MANRRQAPLPTLGSAGQLVISSGSSTVEGHDQINAALLPKNDTSSNRGKSTVLRFVCAFCIALGVVVLIGTAMTRVLDPGWYGKHEEVSTPKWGKARALKKLDKPVLIVISSDGFRWGYNYKVDTPHIDRLRQEGTEAEFGLIPVFPSITFPNHYSIVTGLYPTEHGIVQNEFSDPDDLDGEKFGPKSQDPKWWLGEPIWVTVTKNKLQAATYFWPGSEVKKGPWVCPPKFCPPFNPKVLNEQRVKDILSYFELPSEERPSYMGLYFDTPDLEGHRMGPDSLAVSEAVTKVDSLIGQLIEGLEKKGVYEDVTIVLLGDHGMTANCAGKVVNLTDFTPFIDIPEKWMDTKAGAILGLRPTAEAKVDEVYSKMNKALASGEVKNGAHLKLYLKEKVPEKFRYSISDRLQPIIGIADEGYIVSYGPARYECGGNHGYDNSLLSMRSIFIGRGPQFAPGRKVPSFINVELYNVFTSILRLKDVAPNSGTAGFASKLLLPSE